MKTCSTIARQSAVVFLILAVLVPPAMGQPRFAPYAPERLVKAAADCYSVGQRVASQKGGTLMNASSEKRGGQTVCRIVVRVPGKKGKRPRRMEMVVPAG